MSAESQVQDPASPPGSGAAPRSWSRVILLGALGVVAIVVLGYIGLVFLGSQVHEALRGTVEFGPAGEGCAVSDPRTDFEAGEDVHLAAFLEREVAAGETITVTMRHDGSPAESVDRTFDESFECIGGSFSGDQLEAGTYRLEYHIGDELLAAGEFTVAATDTGAAETVAPSAIRTAPPSTTTPSSSVDPRSSTTSSPTAPSLPSEPFEGLPYAMTLSEGWYGGSPSTYEAAMLAMFEEHPDFGGLGAESMVQRMWIASTTPSAEAASFQGWCPTQAGLSEALLLTFAHDLGDEPPESALRWAETEAIENLKAARTMVDGPTVDRVELPFGPAIRSRWVEMDGTRRVAGTGYVVVGHGLMVQIIFHVDEADGEVAATIEPVVGSLRVATP